MTPIDFHVHATCPLCGGKEWRKWLVIQGYSLVQCLHCTVRFVQNVPSAVYLQEIYQSQEGNCLYGGDNRGNLDYYNAQLKAGIEAWKPGRGAVLDVGCSSGFFLEQMAGWERHGVEISREFGEQARKKLGTDIFLGSFENYPGPEGYFDVITLLDVFDHFPNPEGILRKCRALLKPGGLLVIKVHNISSWFARLSGEKFYALLPPVHLFYYGEKSLQFALAKTGLEFRGKSFIGHRMKIKTVFFRLSRGERSSFMYALYLHLQHRWLGNLSFYKNLHDIITVWARKG